MAERIESEPELVAPPPWPPENPRYKNQAATVLRTLASGEWVCGVVFLSMHIARYSARVYELRKYLGWPIESKKCEIEQHHHEAPLFVFRLRLDMLDAIGKTVEMLPPPPDTE